MSASATLSDRALRYALLALARQWLLGLGVIKVKVTKKGLFEEYHNTTRCLRVPRGKVITVDVNRTGEKIKARYTGLITCGNVWTCPRCSDWISRGRRDDLLRAYAIMQQQSFTGLHLTFTFSHGRRDSLVESIKILKSAFARWRANDAVRDGQSLLGWSYYVVATEITWSPANGWHPHLHVLAFVKNRSVAAAGGRAGALAAVEQSFKDAWVSATKKTPFPADFEHGLNLTFSEDNIAHYIAKFGYLPQKWGVGDEITRGTTKTPKSAKMDGLTPFDMLYASLVDETVCYASLYQEYATAMARRHQLDYSSGFKKYLKAHGLQLLTDETLAAQEALLPDYDVLLSFGVDIWRQILAAGLQAALLDFVEGVNGSPLAVETWLGTHGIEVFIS